MSANDTKKESKKATKKVEVPVESEEDDILTSEGSKIDLDSSPAPFSPEQCKWIEEYVYKRVNELRPMRRRQQTKTEDGMTEEEKIEAQKIKSRQYFHCSAKKIQDKIQSICKAILSKSQINKSHLQSFSSQNIETLREFVLKVKENRDIVDQLDLTDYFTNIKARYGLENKQGIMKAVLDRTLKWYLYMEVLNTDVCPFTEEQRAWLEQYILSKQVSNKSKGSSQTDEEKLSIAKQKQLQYYHLSYKRVMEKLSSVCKAILSKNTINKSHLQSFSKENIEQLRSFIQKIKENKEHTEQIDLNYYVNKMLEKYPGLENKQDIQQVTIDRTLVNF